MRKTLWLLALEGQICDMLFTFYAADQAEAESTARGIEYEKALRRRDLRQFKHGFRVVHLTLPGTIEVLDEEE